MCRDTLRKVWDGSEHPLEGPGRVGTPAGRYGTGRDTLREVRDRSGHPDGGPGRVVTP